MAKMTITIEDVAPTEPDGPASVNLTGKFEGDDEKGTVTNAAILGLCFKRLFEQGWIQSKAHLIMPELFPNGGSLSVTPSQPETKEITNG